MEMNEIAEIGELIARCDQFLEEFGKAQSTRIPLAEDASRRYQEWMGQCLALLEDSEAKERFRGEFEGNTWTSKIKAFLSDPLAMNLLASDGSPDWLGPWKYDFKRCAEGPLTTQRSILEELRSQAKRDQQRRDTTVEVLGTSEVDDLVEKLRRFPEAIKPLGDRRTGKASFDIVDEYDVQDLVEFLLRSMFDDIRAEETTETHAGSSSRIDFLIPQIGLAVEVKFAGPSLGHKKLTEQIHDDIGRYPAHSSAQSILFFVYDPDRVIPNPKGYVEDIEKLSREDLSVRVVLAR